MAISDIKEYAHLTDADVEALSDELTSIRRDITESLGDRDAAYIRRTIGLQRVLDAAARLVIHGSRTTTGWVLGTPPPRVQQHCRDGRRPRLRGHPHHP